MVLDAFQRLEIQTGRQDFAPAEIVREVQAVHHEAKSGPIRTHVCSRMCIDAPTHHGVTYGDLERVGPGRYRRRK